MSEQHQGGAIEHKELIGREDGKPELVTCLHKYCLKCKKWKDADGLSGTRCKTCGTWLVLRHLGEVREEIPRDTQFAGFAKLLAEESGAMPQYAHETIEAMNKRFQLLIAQRAYDLVQHACEAIHDKQSDYEARLTLKSMIESIPDMTEWPDK